MAGLGLDEKRLCELLDKQQIQEVMARYSRAVDRMDMDLLKTCYWLDANDHHGPFNGSAEEFFEIVAGLSDPYSFSQHLICNQYIELDGDTAQSESYFMMPAGIERDGEQMIWLLAGRYVDIFERRNGEWRIRDRVVTHDWEVTLPRTPEVFSPNPFAQGARSTDDIVYRKQAEWRQGRWATSD